MSALHQHTLPAYRLRKGDVLPVHGKDATVTQPPVISVDGSMVTVVVVHEEGDTRLSRVPVDQPVVVARPAETSADFVRLTRVARSTGTQVLVLDLAHPHSDIPPTGGDRFATLCVAHHTVRFFAGISTAEARASHPQEWCSGCGETSRLRAQQRVGGGQARRGTGAQSVRKPA